MAEKKEILVCDNHQSYPVPLIWTFAFNGSEYWCPFCGFDGGMLGSGTRIDATHTLVERGKRFEKFSREYLDAKSAFICSSLEWKGKRISPQELPQEEKARIEKVCRDWKYEVEVEGVEI